MISIAGSANGHADDVSTHSRLDGPAQAVVAPSLVTLPVIDQKGLRFKRISTADGLSQTRVAQIIQDDRGFLWFGTQYGLNRFDGYEFKTFVHEPGEENSMAGAWVFSLFKDRTGKIWIGCNGVLDRLDPATETFTHFQIDAAASANHTTTVVHISQDGAGLLWLATGSGLHSLDPSTGAIRHFRHDPTDPLSLSTNDVKWTGEDRRGRLWVGTSDGLDAFDQRTGHVTLHIPLPDPVQVAFFEDRLGTFWITRATGNGLAQLDPETNTVTQYSFYEHAPPSDALTGVMGMLEDDRGDVWIGSPGAGLLQLDRKQQRFLHFAHRSQDPDSIAEDKVIALFKANDGSIWCGLHSVGPNHFLRRDVQFESIKHDPDDPNSISTDFVNAIYEDEQGSLWVGNDDGLYEFDRRTGARHLRTPNLGFKPMVISIAEDPVGHIWFGTFNHGLSRYDRQSGRITTYVHATGDPTSLSNDQVHKVFFDHSGQLWAATDDGLNRFDSKTQTFTTHKVDPENHLNQTYAAIAEDSDGKLWLGTVHSGLQRFDPTTGRFEVFRSQPKDPQMLRDDTVPSVIVGSNGIVWIGTQNGLNRFDPKTGVFSAYDQHNGLPANTISCLLSDEEGQLWLSTNKGLSHFDPKNQSFDNYSTIDGLPGDDLTGWSTCFRSKHGEMFFAGFAGAVGFRPHAIKEIQPTPGIVLTDLEVGGRPTSPGPHQPLTQSLPYADHVTLEYWQSTFTVSFSGLSYADPQSTRYRYKLDGLDSSWYETSSRVRRAAYTSLPPGHYKLHVESAAARGPWSEPGAALNVTILTPWWSSFWFRGVYVSIIAALTWLFYRARIREVARQWEIRMDARMSERTRIARDLHDTLLQGLISAALQLEVAKDGLPTDSPGFSRVESVFQLLRRMVADSRETVRGLRVDNTERLDLHTALEQLPVDLHINKDTAFRLISTGQRTTLLHGVNAELYWLYREVLSNAIRHSRASEIEATLTYGPQHLILSVRDNGIGIDPEMIDLGQETHWGLQGIQERAARMGAQLNIQTAPGKGTTITVKLAARKAYQSGERGAVRRLLMNISQFFGRSAPRD